MKHLILSASLFLTIACGGATEAEQDEGKELITENPLNDRTWCCHWREQGYLVTFMCGLTNEESVGVVEREPHYRCVNTAH